VSMPPLIPVASLLALTSAVAFNTTALLIVAAFVLVETAQLAFFAWRVRADGGAVELTFGDLLAIKATAGHPPGIASTGSGTKDASTETSSHS
jgi:hypothetical protein